jgi:hypothetical protein
MKHIIIILSFFTTLVFTGSVLGSVRPFTYMSNKFDNIDSIVLENAFVRIHKNTSVKNTADVENFGKRIIVALSKLEYKKGEITSMIDRGGIFVLLPEEPTLISKGEYFEVAFKKVHPEPKGPEVWLEPQKNTIVFEDKLFRIFEERLAPGDTRELHSHAQRVVVRLNKVQLTDPRFYPDGVVGQGIQIPNTVRFAEPMVHVVKNLSQDTPLFNIIIEFKTSIYLNSVK